MGILNRLFGRHRAPEPPTAADVMAMVGIEQEFASLKDPRLAAFMSAGSLTASGVHVSVSAALRNTTVMRCVSLIAFAIGTLPLHLRHKATKEKADDHPLFKVLHRKPNPWQTAFEFRALLQQRALMEGDAFAHIIRAGDRIVALVPMKTVTPCQRNDWTLEYECTLPNGVKRTLQQREVFHLRYGLSDDGITGLSLVKQASEAIGLALQTEKAAARLFRNGMLVGGLLSVKQRLSPEAFERLVAQMDERTGADQAHRWIIGEEGMEAKPFDVTAADSQHIEMRKHQIEDIARPFGVPRPLLGVDDTSWGSGIDVLGQFFVRYALNPWFEAWQQAIERSLLTDQEQDELEAKFNDGALLRGSMKDQAEFFATGLGSGGSRPYLHEDEVRGWLDLPQRNDLPPPPGQTATRTET